MYIYNLPYACIIIINFSINMLHHQVHYHLKDLMTELQQTNLEKTLLAWCRQNSQVTPRCKDIIYYRYMSNVIKINKASIFICYLYIRYYFFFRIILVLILKILQHLGQMD